MSIIEDVNAEDFVEVDEHVEEVEAVVIVIVVAIVDVIVVIKDVDDVDEDDSGLSVLTKNLRKILALSWTTSSGEIVDSKAASFAKAEISCALSSSVNSDANKSAAAHRDFGN